jgi:hypothetical protein
MRLALSTLVPLVLALGACVSHGDEGMVVLNNTAVTGMSCSLTGDPTQPFNPAGIINAQSPQGYLVTPLVESLISPPTQDTISTAQRTIILQGARVHLAIPSGSTTVTLDPAEADFMALFSGSVPPQGTANVAFELVPESVLQKVAALGFSPPVHVEVVATVTMFGTLSGDKIDGQPWQYPVTICNDCVLNDIGVCGGGAGANLGNPCNMFQDGVVDCCEGANGLVCPAQ